MSRSSLCRTGFCLLLLAGFGLSLPGCSKQGEGERCDLIANGSADCDEGLICTVLDTGRCCPPDGAPISDSRCNATVTGTGGTSSTGGSGGKSSGGGNAGGTSGGTATGGTSGGGGAPDSGEGGSGAGGADTTEAGASTGGTGA